jgi:phosphate uptake regulator
VETRKIQKVGRSTLNISLPKKWVNLQKLKRGDTVYIEQRKDGALKVSPESVLKQQVKTKAYTINCDHISEANTLKWLIPLAYTMGYEFIHILSSRRITQKQLEEIRTATKNLIGANIIEVTNQKIMIQCFIDVSKIHVFSLLKRMSVITSTMLHDVMTALVELNPELAKTVIDLEKEADDIYYLLTRLILSSQSSENLAEELGLMDLGYIEIDPARMISLSLTKIADYCREIAKSICNLSEMNLTLEDDLLQRISSLSQLTLDMFTKSVDAFFSGNILEAIQAINLSYKMRNQVETIRKNNNIQEITCLVMVMFSLIVENSRLLCVKAIEKEVNKYNAFPTPH